MPFYGDLVYTGGVLQKYTYTHTHRAAYTGMQTTQKQGPQACRRSSWFPLPPHKNLLTFDPAPKPPTQAHFPDAGTAGACSRADMHSRGQSGEREDARGPRAWGMQSGDNAAHMSARRAEASKAALTGQHLDTDLLNGFGRNSTPHTNKVTSYCKH